MKKIFLTATLIMLMAVSVASAADVATISMETLEKDGAYQVDFILENNPGVSSFELTIFYNQESTPAKVVPSALISDGVFLSSLDDVNFDKAASQMTVVYTGSKNFTDGIIFSVVFENQPRVSIGSLEKAMINEKFEYVAVQEKSKPAQSVGGGGGTKPATKDEGQDEPKAEEQEAEDEAKAPAFSDVKPGEWFYDAVEFASSKGYMYGVGEDEFAPMVTVSRAMFVTVLWRMDGEKTAEASGFSDIVEDAWYKKAVDWAYANKVVNGVTSEEFSPDGKISREQMAAILYRYLKDAEGFSVATKKAEFADGGQISAYAKDAIDWCCENGIMSGKGENIFDPKASANRAEMATVIRLVAGKQTK